MSDGNEQAAPRASSVDWSRWFVALVIVIVVAGVALGGVALGGSKRSPAPTISVTGSGTVEGTPDTMSFQVGVQTTAGTATAALSENNGRLASVEAALLRSGLKKKDLQTAGLNISENTNNQGVITGFSVNDELEVTMHGLSKAGAVLDAAARAAGNEVQLSGVTFSISNDSTLLAAARARAMRSARTEASQVAKGGGTTLGAIVKVTDQENTNNYTYPEPVAFNSATSLRSVPVETGSEMISVQVAVVYALNS